MLNSQVYSLDSVADRLHKPSEYRVGTTDASYKLESEEFLVLKRMFLIEIIFNKTGLWQQEHHRT